MRSLHEAFERYYKQSHLGRLEEALANIDPIADSFSRMGAAVEPFGLHQSAVEVAKRQGLYGIAEIPDLSSSAASQFDVAASHALSAEHLIREEARRLSGGISGPLDLRSAAQAAAHASSLSNPLNLYRSQDLGEDLLANYASPVSRPDLFRGSEMDKIVARIGIVGISAEAVRLQHEALSHRLAGSAVFDQAYELAQAAQQYHLDDYLDPFKTSVGPLTDKMLYLNSLDSIRSEEHLRSFVQASTVADILGNSRGYGFEAQQALAMLTQQAIPQFDSVQEYGHVLKAAGIALAPWPHIRLLTIGERRKRLRQRVDARQESKHAKKAWTVFHRHELTLREIIDMAMTDRYGEDWPHERLEKCGCRTLLGRWKNRGGDLLGHADYDQYIEIMCDDEHFENVFSIGFEDSDELRRLLTKARKLRAAVMHFHPFTKICGIYAPPGRRLRLAY